jgi:hypothetical protein
LSLSIVFRMSNLCLCPSMVYHHDKNQKKEKIANLQVESQKSDRTQSVKQNIRSIPSSLSPRLPLINPPPPHTHVQRPCRFAPRPTSPMHACQCQSSSRQSPSRESSCRERKRVRKIKTLRRSVTITASAHNFPDGQVPVVLSRTA